MRGGSGGRLSYRIAHGGPLEPLLRRLTLLAAHGLWPRCLGRRHVPRGPLVVTGTHMNRMDVWLYLIATGRHIEWVGGEHFLHLPLSGRVAAWSGWRGVRDAEFGGGEENTAALEAATEAARGGAAVGIFSQGFTARFGSGAARAAAAARAPVLPVFLYRIHLSPSSPRVLAIVQRPLPPPAEDARSRRRFVDRLHRRMRALGALRVEGDAVAVRRVALDDPALWRRPLDVIRRTARIGRARDQAALAVRARFVLRACDRLKCSVGDVRRPAGLGTLAAFLALLPLALLGALLVSPPLLAFVVAMRGHPPADVRSTILRLTALVAAPWGIVLLVAGYFAAGPWGVALPLLALVGACAAGVANRLRRRLRGSLGARRHGHRLRARLLEFDRLVAAAGG